MTPDRTDDIRASVQRARHIGWQAQLRYAVNLLSQSDDNAPLARAVVSLVDEQILRRSYSTPDPDDQPPTTLDCFTIGEILQHVDDLLRSVSPADEYADIVTLCHNLAAECNAFLRKIPHRFLDHRPNQPDHLGILLPRRPDFHSAADRAELEWWRHWRTKLTDDSELPPVGSPLTGHVYVVARLHPPRTQ